MTVKTKHARGTTSIQLSVLSVPPPLSSLPARLASVHCPVLTHFELGRLVVRVRVFLHQHQMQDAEGVLNAEDRPVAPGGCEHHQPAVAPLGRDESGSVVAVRVHLDPRLRVRNRRRGEGRLAPGLDQLHVAVLTHHFTLAASRLVILAPVCLLGSISLLHLRIRSRLLRQGNSAGRLIVYTVDPHAVWSGGEFTVDSWRTCMRYRSLT